MQQQNSAIERVPEVATVRVSGKGKVSISDAVAEAVIIGVSEVIALAEGVSESVTDSVPEVLIENLPPLKNEL